MTRARYRLPRTLFGGRMRTSTAILSLIFVGVLLLWYGVRPDPEFTEEVVRVRTTKVTEKELAEKEAAARRQILEEERRRAAATPTPTPTPTPRATKTPTATKSPRATPGVIPPLVSPAPSEEVTPTPTSSREPGGLFGIRRGGDTTPPDDRPPPPPGEAGDTAPSTAEEPE